MYLFWRQIYAEVSTLPRGSTVRGAALLHLQQQRRTNLNKHSAACGGAAPHIEDDLPHHRSSYRSSPLPRGGRSYRRRSASARAIVRVDVTDGASTCDATNITPRSTLQCTRSRPTSVTIVLRDDRTATTRFVAAIRLVPPRAHAPLVASYSLALTTTTTAPRVYDASTRAEEIRKPTNVWVGHVALDVVD